MIPKKLIRSRIISKLKEGEWETITDQQELNNLNPDNPSNKLYFESE